MSDTLRVAFPYDKKVDAYEPTKIHLAPEYIFLENIYSPLIELSPANGTPIAGMAQSFEWKNGKLYLEIRQDQTTIDGQSITVKDVEFSLKRLLVLSGNTHGNFKDLVCPNQEVKTVEDDCDGIQIENNTLILDTHGEKPFLIPMLAMIDFAIIPKASVDPKTLQIIDYKNTSGPYYVASDNGQGDIILKAKKSHYNYAANIPQEIKLVPSGVHGAKDSITLFKENKIDYITTIDKLNPEKIIKFARESNQNLHSTMNIRTFVLVFTSKGMKKYSAKQRLAIGKNIRKVFRNYYKDIAGYEETNQFFPVMGDGSLTDEQNEQVENIFKHTLNEKINDLHISIVRLGDVEQFKPLIHSVYENATVSEGKNAPAFIKYKSEDEMPDCFIGGPDTGFMEDIGLISYTIYAGILGMNREQGHKWLANYMTILDKKKRMEALRELHFQTLKDGIIIPFVSAPYVALARKTWEIKLSQLYANNPLWPIIHK